MAKIYEFLDEKYPDVYTYDELKGIIGLPKEETVAGYNWAYFDGVVNRLQKEGIIEIKTIDRQTYYKAKERNHNTGLLKKPVFSCSKMVK